MKERFPGGLNSVNDSRVPFEQTGYWIDGMVRTGHLIGDEKLLEKAKPRVYNPIEYIDEEGFIGPQYLKNGTVWAHAVFFRALIAEYTATKDERILEALKRHLLRVPLNGTVASGDATTSELVPYCTTRLRIAIFPVVHEHP